MPPILILTICEIECSSGGEGDSETGSGAGRSGAMEAWPRWRVVVSPLSSRRTMVASASVSGTLGTTGGGGVKIGTSSESGM